MTGINDRARLSTFDSLKGVLILLVVLGHNLVFSARYPLLFSVLYNFHVACFLLLPFVYDSTVWSHIQLKVRFIRYLVPHLVFFFIASGLYFFAYVPGDEIRSWFHSLLIALVFFSEETSNQACGFRLFWFLPALCSLIVLLVYFWRVSRRLRAFLLFLFLLIHCLLGFVPQTLLSYIPWSLPLILFLFPLGLLAGLLWKNFAEYKLIYIVAWIVFPVCVLAGIRFQSYAGLAGDPRVYSLNEPVQLLFHDVYLLSAFFALMGLARFFSCSLLVQLGRCSLFIYLTHSFFYQLLACTSGVDYVRGKGLGENWIIIVTFIGTIMSVCLLNRIMRRFPYMYACFFPKNLAKWPVYSAWNSFKGR